MEESDSGLTLLSMYTQNINTQSNKLSNKQTPATIFVDRNIIVYRSIGQ